MRVSFSISATSSVSKSQLENECFADERLRSEKIEIDGRSMMQVVINGRAARQDRVPPAGRRSIRFGRGFDPAESLRFPVPPYNFIMKMMLNVVKRAVPAAAGTNVYVQSRDGSWTRLKIGGRFRSRSPETPSSSASRVRGSRNSRFSTETHPRSLESSKARASLVGSKAPADLHMAVSSLSSGPPSRNLSQGNFKKLPLSRY